MGEAACRSILRADGGGSPPGDDTAPRWAGAAPAAFPGGIAVAVPDLSGVMNKQAIIQDVSNMLLPQAQRVDHKIYSQRLS